jgi:hypothetical protein
MRLTRTITESRVSARLPLSKRWVPSKEDLREQQLALRAIETGEFDGLSDEEWCEHLEQAHA